MILAIIVISVFIILASVYMYLYLDVKNKGLHVEANVLGYYEEFKSIYMVLQFKDANEIIHTIAKHRGCRKNYIIEPHVRVFKEDSRINITYKERKNHKKDFEKKFIVLDNGKEVELTDDGKKFDIIYNSKWNDESEGNFLKAAYGIVGLTIVVLLVILIISIN